MSSINPMKAAVRAQHRADFAALERLEILIDERKEIARIAGERLVDAVLLQREVRDGFINAQEALAEIAALERRR